ncbi:Uncharacterized protein PBTT_07771 [Plasmodiophora brassicae]|uniref:Uncharacterized protein n=1 Tax=Plasmodiophora brassicae TaxID=37360 RepID=A0A0G4IXF4_PLABS|nr:hypothetical protein PBRA_007744 [Plasmodiophora brassicae]SPQ99048.1 unnamed protein product [Plasmodiophora brassicae]
MRWASLLVVGLAAIARGTGPGPTVFTFTPMGPTGPVWSVARVRFFDADGEVSTANATASATTSLPFDPGNVLRDDDAVWSCDRTLTCGCAIVVSFRNRDASRPVINRALLTQAPPGNDTYPADSVVCIRKRGISRSRVRSCRTCPASSCDMQFDFSPMAPKSAESGRSPPSKRDALSVW